MKTLVLAVASLLLLSGCMVDQDKWRRAEDVCKEHGGLNFIWIGPGAEITCYDGFAISINNYGKSK